MCDNQFREQNTYPNYKTRRESMNIYFNNLWKCLEEFMIARSVNGALKLIEESHVEILLLITISKKGKIKNSF